MQSFASSRSLIRSQLRLQQRASDELQSIGYRDIKISETGRVMTKRVSISFVSIVSFTLHSRRQELNVSSKISGFTMSTNAGLEMPERNEYSECGQVPFQ